MKKILLLISLLFTLLIEAQIIPNGGFDDGVANWTVSGNNLSIVAGLDTGHGYQNDNIISIINTTSVSEQFILNSSQFSLLKNEVYNLSISYGHYVSGFGGGQGIEYSSLSQINSLNLKDTNGDIVQTINLTNCSTSGDTFNPPLLNSCSSNNFTVTNTGSYIIEIVSSVGKSNDLGFIPNEFFVFDKVDLIKKNDDHSILGNIKYDSNSNCTSSSNFLSNIQLKTTGANGTYYTSTNTNGDYTFNFEENGNVTTEIIAQGLNSTPKTNSFVTGTSQTETNQDFCVSSSTTGDDVSVIIIPTSDARPGFTSRYRIEYKNTGSTTVSGDVVLNYEDFKMHSPVSNPVENSSTINSLKWNYTGLTPFEIRTIDVEFTNNTPTQNTNPLVGGESFNFTANITPLNSDINQSNNNFNLSHLVVNSYDPNDATILEGSQITTAQATQDLHFRIRFQNTGSASAININVKTVLDTDLDWATFMPISSSHSYSTSVNTTTGEVNFNYPNINLADSLSNEPASHGWVVFKAKPKSSFGIGDKIECGADIFFDYNAPIVTNVAQTEIFVPSTTAIPDAKFEEYLETHKSDGSPVTIGDATSMGDGSINQEVPTAKINTVTQLYLSFLEIEKLDGIEDFDALENFTFQGNDTAVTSINLTDNSNLKTLSISGFPNLSSIDISGLLSLTDILLSNLTGITSLDYSNITSLDKIQISRLSNLLTVNVTALNTLTEFSISNSSGITSLDLSPLIGLTQLILSNNDQLSTLNLATGSTSTINYVQLNGNPLLTCVEVDTGIPINGLSTWNAGNGSIFNEDCNNPQTYVPDDNFEAYLEANSMGNGIANDNKVFTNNINAVTVLDISNKSITDLTGITAFTALVDFNASTNTIAIADLSLNTSLEVLNLSVNNLTTINLNTNTLLKQLSINNNSLQNLSLSDNTALEILEANNNLIQNMNLTLNTALTSLDLSTNDLQTLNLKNTTNTIITFIDLRQNSSLACIEVDSVTYSTTNWTNIDGGSPFSLDCMYPTTEILDAVFEDYLETHDRDGNLVSLGDLASMGNGIANDKKVFTHRINTVTDLNVSNLDISSFKGVEDFKDLELFNLFGGNNVLVSIDLSQNVKLEKISLTFVQTLTNVTLGNLPELIWLQLGFSNISTIDITGLPKLDRFVAQGDKLNGLDTSGNPVLKTLSVASNQVLSLDLSSNLLLESLSADGNLLTSLDVSANTELQGLSVSNNQIKNLDISNNSKLTGFGASNNLLETLNLKSGGNNILPGSFGPGVSNFPFDIRNNPSLTCIQVDDITYSNTNWTAIDSQHTFNTVCANSLTYVPDAAFETYLETHDKDGNIVSMGDSTSMGNATSINDPLDGYVLTNRINTVKELKIDTQNSGMVSLVGLEDFKDLEVFWVYPGEDAIKTLDFSSNSKLKDIGLTSCSDLASINLGGLPDLTIFSLRGNNLVPDLDFSNSLSLERLTLESSQVSNLDFSSHTSLKNIQITGNTSISSLNLANNFNTSVTTFSLNGNTNLSCVQVDSVSYSTTNWTNTDVSSTFSTDCSSTWAVMTNQTTTTALLIISGLDADNDGTITIAEAAAYTGDANGLLDLSGSGITDVEGLGAFTSILKLDVSGNGITDLGPLTGSTFMTVSKSSGAIRVVQKTQAMALEEIVLSNNNFNVIDVSSLTNLKVIKLNDNPDLITVNLKNGNNASITTFDSSNTPNLTCILVDDPNATYLTTWTKDEKNTFVADEAQCRAEVLSIDNFDITNKVTLYPNPVTDYLKIELQNQLEIKNIQVYNVIGKLINETKTKEVDFTKASKGIYLLKIMTNKGVVTKKVIKN